MPLRRGLLLTIERIGGDRDDRDRSERRIVASAGVLTFYHNRSAKCLLLAQSGHADRGNECPLLGVKRTFGSAATMSVMTQSGN
jgi:hypothetical protein